MTVAIIRDKLLIVLLTCLYMHAVDDADKVAAAVAMETTPSRDTTPDINNWKTADVGNWLLRNNLEHLQTWYD